ncbi:MAG: hypothetical protein FWH37_03665 [Candidatus Bathyarchaeota archaeon]|nr:hypothetical protein [Candidatus Termiticorpusculum sp.]
MKTLKAIFLKELKLGLRMNLLVYTVFLVPLFVMYVFTPIMPALFLETSLPLTFLSDYLFSQPLSIMLFVYFLFMQEAFVKEKAENNLETVLSSPVKPVDLWLGKTVAVFVLSYVVMVLISFVFVFVSFVFMGVLVVSLVSVLSFLVLLPLVALFFFGLSGILALTLKNVNLAGVPLILLALLFFFLKNNVFNSLTIFVIPMLALFGFVVQYFYVKKMSKSRIILSV